MVGFGLTSGSWVGGWFRFNQVVTSWIGLLVRESTCVSYARRHPALDLTEGWWVLTRAVLPMTERLNRKSKKNGERKNGDTGGLPDALHYVPKFNPGSSSHCISLLN